MTFIRYFSLASQLFYTMKKYGLVILLLLGRICNCMAQTNSPGPHGGELRSTGYYKVEAVDCNKYLEIYLYELDLCPILNYSFNGRVDFHYPDNSCYSSKLYAYGVDSFSAEMSDHCYDSYIVYLHSIGVSIKAEFPATWIHEDCRTDDPSADKTSADKN